AQSSGRVRGVDGERRGTSRLVEQRHEERGARLLGKERRVGLHLRAIVDSGRLESCGDAVAHRDVSTDQAAMLRQGRGVQRHVGAAAGKKRERKAKSSSRETAKLHSSALPVRTHTRKSHRRGARGTDRGRCSDSPAWGKESRRGTLRG